MKPFLLAAVAVAPVAHAAITFNLNFIDNAGLGQSWDASRQSLVTQAANEWGSLFVNDYTIDVDITYSSAGTSSGAYLGRWTGSYGYFVGDDITPWYSGMNHTVTFNVDFFTTEVGRDQYLWWDSTPLDGSDQPFYGWDALSIARHEFGHLLGFTAGVYVTDKGNPGEIDPWGDLLVGSAPIVFDPTGLNVEMYDEAHTANSGGSAGDLMNPSLVNGVRRDISTLDLQMLTTAYGYALTMVPEPSTLSLLGGLLAFALVRRRRR